MSACLTVALTLVIGLVAAGCGTGPTSPPPVLRSEGVIFEPEWEEFRPYLDRMFAAVQQQWEGVMIESRIYPASGTKVKVRFRLDRRGFVTSIEEVEGDAGTHAEKMCVTAIATQKGYGVWSDQMVSALGESDELTFTFHYQ